MLPAHWTQISGYLIGPDANLYQASLPGAHLAGADLERVQAEQANLSGADLTGADLHDADLNGANLRNAKLAGANVQAFMELTDLTSANLSNADLRRADISQIVMAGTDFAGASMDGILMYGPGKLKGTPTALPAHYAARAGYLFGPGVRLYYGVARNTDLSGLDLAGADLRASDLSLDFLNNVNLTSATLIDAIFSQSTFTGATWLHTVCPDGSNSDHYVKGCFSPLDTAPPTVAVTGVAGGHVYVIGAVPAAGCKTTDNGTVAHAATVKVATTGTHGVGHFTATCSGAVDLAGNQQKAPVVAGYTVGYGVKGFLTPGAGATIPRSWKFVNVRFRLTSANGSPIPASLASALAVAHDVRVTLRGPGISAVTVNCGWNAAQRYLACAIRIPPGARAGSSQRYTLTVTENLGNGFVTAPGVRGGTDPEVIHFR